VARAQPVRRAGVGGGVRAGAERRVRAVLRGPPGGAAHARRVLDAPGHPAARARHPVPRARRRPDVARLPGARHWLVVSSIFLQLRIWSFICLLLWWYCLLTTVSLHIFYFYTYLFYFFVLYSLIISNLINVPSRPWPQLKQNAFFISYPWFGTKFLILATDGGIFWRLMEN